jgi:cation/acetate symporter
MNKDGIVQLSEIRLGQDIVVLATPEIAGLPYVISGLVAAGGLAAALSTADGLLLTISNALSHDTYYKMINPHASTQKRVTISKILLLVVALVAAYVTLQRPGDILFMVGAAFSLAASAFFPALVLGVFWKRANQAGALAGMIVGIALCAWYMGTRYEFFQRVFGLDAASWPLWFGIQPISSGVFGVPAGLLTLVVVSLFTPTTDTATRSFVDNIRIPRLLE